MLQMEKLNHGSTVFKKFHSSHMLLSEFLLICSNSQEENEYRTGQFCLKYQIREKVFLVSPTPTLILGAKPRSTHKQEVNPTEVGDQGVAKLAGEVGVAVNIKSQTYAQNNSQNPVCGLLKKFKQTLNRMAQTDVILQNVVPALLRTNMQKCLRVS